MEKQTKEQAIKQAVKNCPYVEQCKKTMEKNIDYHKLRRERPIKYWFLQMFCGYPYIDVKNNDSALYY